MKSFALIAGLVLLSGCQSYFDEQQALVDRQNADQDRAWCESVGIAPSDARYLTCRSYAAELRLQGEAQADVRALGLMGTGAALYSQPATTTTCQGLGSSVTCQSY